MKFFITLYALLLVSSHVLAAGSGSITDLKFPAINFVILFGFIIFKIRKPLAEGFTKNSKDVEQLFNHAEERDKEAQIKLDVFRKKIQEIDSVTGRIHEEARQDLEKFKTTLKHEMEEKLKKLEKDSADKLEYEKSSLVKGLEEELLNKVVALAKGKISTDKQTQDRVTEKLLGKL